MTRFWDRLQYWEHGQGCWLAWNDGGGGARCVRSARYGSNELECSRGCAVPSRSPLTGGREARVWGTRCIRRQIRPHSLSQAAFDADAFIGTRREYVCRLHSRRRKSACRSVGTATAASGSVRRSAARRGAGRSPGLHNVQRAPAARTSGPARASRRHIARHASGAPGPALGAPHSPRVP